MAAKKGHSKSGGRGKGTPNKVTQSMREWVQMIIDNNRARLENDLQALEPKERWQLIEKLMQYVIPKQREITDGEEMQEFRNWKESRASMGRLFERLGMKQTE
jgi:uncharacterized protein (UPF0305 family)